MLTQRHDPTRAGERGATMVIMALFLTVMLGLSALVVDLGAARHEKRKVQNLSDSASLAAAQELGDLVQTPAQRMADAQRQVTDYVERQHPTPPAGSASWADAWASCTDANALEVASASGPCISFGGPDEATSASEFPAKIRVRIPNTTVQPYFTEAVGAPDTQVAAASTARIASRPPFQGRLILPFAHGPEMNRPWVRRWWRPRRSSPSLGLMTLYDDNNLNMWSRSCRQVDSTSRAACVFKSPRTALFPVTNEQDALKVNLAMGLDHDLATYPPGAPESGPPGRICDGAVEAPCTTSNLLSGEKANHVITAEGVRWNCFLIIFCRWQTTGSYDSWRQAVDQGLAFGANTARTFTVGGTTFCARLARPAIGTVSSTDYKEPVPGGSCTPDAPTVQFRLSRRDRRTVNGRHISYYMFGSDTTASRNDTTTPFGHFWGSPGGPAGSKCTGDPSNPNPASDTVDNNNDARDDRSVFNAGGTSSVDSGSARLGKFLTQSATTPYLCLNPPTVVFKAAITRDPRFAWMAVVQNDCSNSGWNFWAWSWGDNFGWNRDPDSCTVKKAKYILELRAVYMDEITTNNSWLSPAHVDTVKAWVFDPALIEPWTSIGPAPTGPPIEYQGGPAVAVLEN